MRLMIHKLLVIFCLALALPALGQEEDERGGRAALLGIPVDTVIWVSTRGGRPAVLFAASRIAVAMGVAAVLLSYTRTPEADWTEMEILYPIIDLSLVRRGVSAANCGVFQSFRRARACRKSGRGDSRYFHFISSSVLPDTNLNYTALVPIYGDLKNRLFRDEIQFVLFPLYSETRKKDVVTDNYLYPIFDVRRGDHLTGWQFWPVAGVEHKAPTCGRTRW